MGIEFGYHPISDDLNSVLPHGPFARAIVIGETIDTLLDEVGAVRTKNDESLLPTGIYWFTGIEEPLLLQLGDGAAPGPSTAYTPPEITDDDPHPLFDALAWAEQYWREGAPVPAPKFQVDSTAITLPAGSDVLIRGRRFNGTQWSYTVRGAEGTQSVLESKLQPIEVAESPDAWVTGELSTAARFGATLTRTKLVGRFADTLYSFRATRTQFFPYQFKPVLKLLQTGKARLLIADEVGLGKTIEAGLIWTELEARHEADRVLVVCPASLVDKWRDEMDERFGFPLTVLDRAELGKFLDRHSENRLPPRQAYVCSLETLRTWSGLDELEDNPPEFDLVIVDEAHSMRNSDTKSYELGLQLSDWSIGANMVFLTATPINLRETDLLNLLGLLEPGDYEEIDDLDIRLQPNAVLNKVGSMLLDRDARWPAYRAELERLHGLAFERAITARAEYAQLVELLKAAPLVSRDVVAARRLLAELNALSTTITRTRKAEVQAGKALRREGKVQVRWSPTESDFYAKYMEWCRERAAVAGTPMYFSMQMPIRLASTSLYIAARQVLGWTDSGARGDETEELKSSSVPPREELTIAARAVAAIQDPKMNKLRAQLLVLRDEGKRALLFTWSRAVLEHLQAGLGNDFRVAVLHGGVSKDRRRKIMAGFRSGEYDFVFANRVASEGLDFEFCSAVINYDLPWNPMEIEQRIGRIDRIGQIEPVIQIVNFYNDEAIDSRILARLLDRIEIFKRSIGELEPIITAAMEHLREAMDFSLTLDEQLEKARQFETAIETQKAGLKDLGDASAGLLIANDVDVAGLEEELVRTGRYLGQHELANLLDDWAQTDGGAGVTVLPDGGSIEFRGNAAMADRLVVITQQGRRTSAETRSLATDLRNLTPVRLALQQELARTSGLELLSATSPLVIAATEVPGHRHARFASVRIAPTENVNAGQYLVVLAHATGASRGGDEIWGSAVTMDGRRVGEAPADALLAGLARGALGAGSAAPSPDLPRLAHRAMDSLDLRWQETQERRDTEEGALTETRRIVLKEQFERRLAGIQRRLNTNLARGRSEKVLRMSRGALRKTTERYEATLAELDLRKPEAIKLKYLAVCLLEVG